MELAVMFLEEGKELIDKDPVQASEKLYKATEEAIKAFDYSLQVGYSA
jgi:PaREP1/PaREP8 domain containing family protein